MIDLDKVYHMDNLELLKQIPNNSIDLVHIDPPFSVGKYFYTTENEDIIQEINFNLLQAREFLYANIYDDKDFLDLLRETNKRYGIKLKTIYRYNELSRICKYYIGNIGDENIYNIPIIVDYLKEV